MPHWRAMTDSEWFRCYDLDGKDLVAKIVKVTAGEVVGEGGKRSRKPVLHMIARGNVKLKPFAISATDAKTIARMYGNETNGWHGKLITLFPSQTKVGGEMVPCVRIRPEAPQQAAQNDAEKETA